MSSWDRIHTRPLRKIIVETEDGSWFELLSGIGYRGVKFKTVVIPAKLYDECENEKQLENMRRWVDLSILSLAPNARIIKERESRQTPEDE